MKSVNKILIIAGLIAGTTLATDAQNTYSGYFLDNYTYRFQMNPAFGNDDKTGFVSMPGIGNINLAIRGNLHLTDIFYNVDGRTSLFTNPNVGVNEVMKKIGNRNKIGTNDKIDILSAGFKAFGGYNTVSISAVVNAEASIPGSFFSLAKEGITNKTYAIDDMFGYANAYAQIALNHSRDIKQVPGLRVGAAVKFLIGVGSIDFRFKEADLTLGTDSWIARTNADIYASITGFSFDQKKYYPKGNQGDLDPRDYVSGGKVDGFGLNGFGMGFDLGAEYKWTDFKFSAALLDLGFIAWGKTAWASTNGTQTINTDAYTFSTQDDSENSFKHQFDNIKDDASKLYQLKDNGYKNSYTRGLAATLNLGVDYEFPYYRKLHFGLLNSTRINGNYSWTQFRLSANVNPVKFFSADINLGVGTYGASFGWLINFHHTGINFFLGMDHTMGKVCKQFIPLSSNASFNMGLNFPF